MKRETLNPAKRKEKIMAEIKKMRPGGKGEPANDAAEALWEEEEESGAEDIYQVYMEELAAVAPCSEEENEALLKRICRGDEDAKTRLIEGNLKRALFFVQDYINRGVPMADLIQEASMELMLLAGEGIEGSFEKLLESRIRVRLDEVLKEDKLEADIAEEMAARVNVLQEVSKRMAEELGREANLSELAERMKMTEDEIREIMKITMDALSISGQDMGDGGQ